MWGQQWRSRIYESLNDVTFLIPIITPGFFNSKPCRDEIELFLKREIDLDKSDLILPIYYIDYPAFNDAERRSQDPLMVELAKHQYEDWRELRHESITSAAVGRKISKLAEALRDALDQRPPAAPSGARVSEAPRTRRRREQQRASDLAGDGMQQALEGEIQARLSPAPMPEPPTLVVSPLHRGDYTSITEAINAAKPGTIIMVEAGLYHEGLVVDKPLEILGQGEVGDVVIEANDKHVILFQATMGRVANLTLRQLGNQFCAVGMTRGRLDLEDCDVTGGGSACVLIRNGADPRLRRNRIHGGVHSVVVWRDSRGTLEDNDIIADANAGVVIAGGDPSLRRNRIHGGRVGVLIDKEGRGILEDNEIFANVLAGVAIKSGGNPTLRRNRIHNNKLTGVFIYGEGRGTLEDNEIFRNSGAGVLTQTGGNPTVRRNHISNNGHEAIWVQKGGSGTFAGNDLRGNHGGAWDIADDCQDKVVLRDNQE